MFTYRLRIGEPGRDYTRAGLVIRALGLAGAWHHDPDAFQGTIGFYMRQGVQ
jgi:hypothetical protein